MCESRLTDNHQIQIFIKNTEFIRPDKDLSAMSARTSEGNSAQRRSHMKMALRHMKCRKLFCTQSTSMASIGEEKKLDSSLLPKCHWKIHVTPIHASNKKREEGEGEREIQFSNRWRREGYCALRWRLLYRIGALQLFLSGFILTRCRTHFRLLLS